MPAVFHPHPPALSQGRLLSRITFEDGVSISNGDTLAVSTNEHGIPQGATLQRKDGRIRELRCKAEFHCDL